MVERAFPLFEPPGERRRAPVMRAPASDAVTVGGVFTAQRADEPTKIWTIVAWPAHIAYCHTAIRAESRGGWGSGNQRVDRLCADHARSTWKRS